MPKEIRRADNCNTQQTEQPAQKLVPKEIQEANTKINKEKRWDGIPPPRHSLEHNIDFEGTKIFMEEKNYWRMLIIEGMEIKNLGDNRANRQVGYEIDECWNPILEKLKL